MESNESRGGSFYYDYGESASESASSYYSSVKSNKTQELEREIRDLQEQLKLQKELDGIENRRDEVLKKMQKYRK